MKTSTYRLLDAINRLNSDSRRKSCVEAITLELINGNAHRATKVEIVDEMIFADVSITDTNSSILMVYREDVTALKIEINVAACRALKFDPYNLPALLRGERSID